MDSSTSADKVYHFDSETSSSYRHSHARGSSADQFTNTRTETDLSCAHSADSVPSFVDEVHPLRSNQLMMMWDFDSGRTTYYHYGSNGSVTSSYCNPIANYVLHEFTPNEHRGDMVGAYLSRQTMTQLAHPAPEIFHGGMISSQINAQQHNSYADLGQEDQNCWSTTDYDSYNIASTSYLDHAATVGFAGSAPGSGPNCPYPNPEDIRHLHSLFGLLPYLQPQRRLNALSGPVMDIVEQDTGNVLAYAVPKKLLVLFLGRQVVNKFIRTMERRDTKKWRGPPTVQELFLPRGHSSQSAIRILLSWMIRACQYQNMGSMRQIKIPLNTFAACSLAQTLELFGLYNDCLRVDMYISKTHFVRPIFAPELESIWNSMSEDSKYTYTVIKVVGKRLEQYESGLIRTLPGVEEILALLEEYPTLKARVRDLGLNETFHPLFGREWMKEVPGSSKMIKRVKVVNNARSHQIAEPELPVAPVHPEELPKRKRNVAVLRIMVGTNSEAQSKPEARSKNETDQEL